ncbi:MAG TPA: sigma-70 family RNA polymerase sigma factor, partial [Vicinamibacterales bacterium]|nr:sigma-70 family RNA polymerase sigma factor [Vicinamibacterales bacterium]
MPPPDLSTLPDGRLAALALAGSQAAFRELVRRYERPVLSLVTRLVRDPALAEDVAQESFLKAFQALASFDARRRFSSWLFRIAHHAALDALRRRRPDAVTLDDPAAGEPAVEPFDPTDRLALARALDDALGRLRPEHRAALVLRYHEGLSYAEIAEALEIPEGTAKTYVHRARRRMAELLGQAGWPRA